MFRLIASSLSEQASYYPTLLVSQQVRSSVQLIFISIYKYTRQLIRESLRSYTRLLSIFSIITLLLRSIVIQLLISRIRRLSKNVFGFSFRVQIKMSSYTFIVPLTEDSSLKDRSSNSILVRSLESIRITGYRNRLLGLPLPLP